MLKGSNSFTNYPVSNLGALKAIFCNVFYFFIILFCLPFLIVKISETVKLIVKQLNSLIVKVSETILVVKISNISEFLKFRIHYGNIIWLYVVTVKHNSLFSLFHKNFGYSASI